MRRHPLQNCTKGIHLTDKDIHIVPIEGSIHLNRKLSLPIQGKVNLQTIEGNMEFSHIPQYKISYLNVHLYIESSPSKIYEHHRRFLIVPIRFLI